MIAQLGGMALDQALATKTAETKQIWMTAYGLGAQYGVLMPYGRTQESEADHLGLIFMAMAGYDPHAALTFWQRMAAQGGSKPPEILSTHPSDETRIADIAKAMPEAMTYYHK
jgi:predicted Zn-dependent protease